MEKVKSDDDSIVTDTTLVEAEDSSDDDESTEEARASDAEHCKEDKLRNVEMESQSDKPEGEEDPDLATVPMMTSPLYNSLSGVPEFNHSQDNSETQEDDIWLLDGSGRHVLDHRDIDSLHTFNRL